MPVSGYTQIDRSIKYAFLFIVMTFITMFFIQFIANFNFHGFHYLMTGFSLVLFYTVLLSLTEHYQFTFAYFVASIMTVVLNSAYLFGVTRKFSAGLIVFTQLSAVYGFIYTILNQEDYALMTGAFGLWILLAATMYFTRKIDWTKLSSKFTTPIEEKITV